MPYRIRPIGDRTPFGLGEYLPDRFKTPWSTTERELEREVAHLQNVRWGMEDFILEIDVLAGNIRKDGRVMARALVSSPAVRVSFQTEDEGDMHFATDAFATWQSNARAIALGLHDLRRIERYQLGKGKQYSGYAQIEGGRGMPMKSAGGITDDDAKRILRHAARCDASLPMREQRAAAIRNTHPDRNGETSRSAFEAVMGALRHLGID